MEEGKLGPDQMQVAQGRVSSGNPLAKVLTELGYISQRELADAARLKVEKILTSVYHNSLDLCTDLQRPNLCELSMLQ